MNKIIRTVLAALIVFPMLVSCYDDKGNYDYISEDEAMPVKIGSLEDVTVKANNQLTITPEVTGEEGGNFKYIWYTVANDYPYDTDTLSQERNLDVNIPLKVGEYTLYYKVTNEANGVYKCVKAPMTVTASDVAGGWYVLKKGDKGVDFDYFSLTGKNDKKDFLTSVLGMEQGLEGDPVSILYMSGGYGNETTNADGSVNQEQNITAYQVVSTKGYYALSGSDLTMLKDLDQAFYEKPATINLQCIDQDNSNTCILINNGKCHLLGSSIGKFGYQPAGDYELLPSILTQEYDDIVFDAKHGKFYAFDNWNKNLGECMDLYGTLNYEEIGFKVSHFLPHKDKDYICDAYCIGYSSVDDKYYVSHVPFMTNYIWGEVNNYEFPSTSPLLQSKVMAAPQSASVIYFAIGNKLYMHMVNTGDDRLIKTFAEGEEISFIKNISGKDKDGDDFDDVVVLTNTAAGYNVYQFPLNGSAGELHTDSAPVMSGTGKASFIMFRQK